MSRFHLHMVTFLYQPALMCNAFKNAEFTPDHVAYCFGFLRIVIQLKADRNFMIGWYLVYFDMVNVIQFNIVLLLIFRSLWLIPFE